MNTKKIVLSFIATIIILWVSQYWILGYWLMNSYFSDNIYMNDIVIYIYPLLAIFLSAFYFWKKKSKEIVKGIIIGGIIYCSFFYLMTFWGINEICNRYFFNLFTTCPGIK